jgi:hypothetical protein
VGSGAGEAAVTSAAAPAVHPWRELWNARLRRSSAVAVEAVAFAIGFHLTLNDRIDWFQILFTAFTVEIGMLMLGDPNAPPPAAHVLAWSRGLGQRMMAYGAVAVAGSIALVVHLARPANTVLLTVGVTVLTLGGLTVILGASLIYWSSPLVRGWARKGKPNAMLVPVMSVVAIGWSGYAVVERAQRTGAWEASRIVGMVLVVVAVALSVMNPPSVPAEDVR